MSSHTPAHQLLQTVVDGGYCVGCGACAAVPDSPLTIRLDDFGRFQAKLSGSGDMNVAVADVCPFSDSSPDEDHIAALRFPDAPAIGRLGRVIGTYAGHVAAPGFRDRGSSGGMGTWLLAELLGHGHVDAVAHVGTAPDASELRFEYTISRDLDSIMSGAKSRYYPVQLVDLIAKIKASNERYALIGVPCFIKAIHHLRERDRDLAERIPFTVALFCGQFKTTRFADALGWEVGIRPGELHGIDFRRKIPGRPSSKYGVALESADGTTVTAPMEGMTVQHWGHGCLKYSACDFCDDVAGETADASIGDAWLPEYDADYRGANVLVTRSALVDDLVRAAIDDGRLAFQTIEASRIEDSQAASFRHRRTGLAFRLAEKDAAGIWRPRKRVRADATEPTRRYRKIFRLRSAMTAASNELFERAMTSGDWNVFANGLRPMMRKHDRLSATPVRRWLGPVKTLLRPR